MPRLEALLADLWDLTYKATGAKKPVTYPRPWPAPVTTRQKGNAAGRTPDEVKALLRDHFGQPQAPV